MHFYEIDKNLIDKYFIAVKKDPKINFDLKLNYKEVKDLVDVVWEDRCTITDAAEIFYKKIKEQGDAGNRGEIFKSTILYASNGENIMQES